MMQDQEKVHRLRVWQLAPLFPFPALVVFSRSLHQQGQKHHLRQPQIDGMQVLSQDGYGEGQEGAQELRNRQMGP